MQTRRGIYVNPQQKVRCQTRQGIRAKKMTSHHQIMTERNNLKRKAQDTRNYKAPKRSRDDVNTGTDHFEALPDDLVIAIFRCLSSTASCPADLANAMLACRRFCCIAMHPLVLVQAGSRALAVKASLWSDGADRFLKRCADFGNMEACYTLGMIHFYCLGNRSGGASLMAKAAMASEASALHSLGIIQFNGSGGTKREKDLKAGVALCARAASLGHVEAMRDLGHCLQDGYGVQRNIIEGRRLMLEANAREAAAAGITPPLASLQTALRLTASSQHEYFCTDKKDSNSEPVFSFLHTSCCSLLSDFGCNVPPPEPHIANKFLLDWFSLCPPQTGLRLCSNEHCGRPETRRHEFRRCSACSSVNYCSRACQALDWKTSHRYVCMPQHDWDDLHADNDNDDEDEDFEEQNDS